MSPAPPGPPVVPVVVAPDKFRGSLTAAEAAEAMAAGALDAATTHRVELDLRLRPVADGGEGTVEALVAAGWQSRRHRVSGPNGATVLSAYALSPAAGTPRTAVVELAAASGLGLLPGGTGDGASARTATTRGTGELVAAALDENVARIVLGVGGSATTDGGTGLATALGLRLLDGDDRPLPPGGAALTGLARVDTARMDPRLAEVEVVVACDVDNPLTGPRGAAQVYAPQKGAAPEDVASLDAGLSRLAQVLRRDLGVDVERVPGAGAAGGAGAGALAFLGARLVPGVDLLLDLVGFDDALPGAALVLTGEGSFDRQTLAGKAPLGVARRARAAGVPVAVLAGRVDLTPAERNGLAALGVVDVRELLELEPNPERAVQDAAALLRRLAACMVAAWMGTTPEVPPQPATTA